MTEEQIPAIPEHSKNHLMLDWGIRFGNPRRIEILQETAEKLLYRGEIFFPYTGGLTHSHHATTSEMALKRLNQYQEIFERYEDFRRKHSDKSLREAIDSFYHRKISWGKDDLDQLVEMMEKINDIAQLSMNEMTKRKKQEEIIMIARSYGVKAYWHERNDSVGMSHRKKWEQARVMGGGFPQLSNWIQKIEENLEKIPVTEE